jgi:DNA modification methylase
VYSSAGIETDEDWSFRGANTQEHLHGLHPYPARFIPQIPRRAIEEWSKPGECVLDPFAGGGTTLLEASLAGRPSVGVDNNAVAHLVASAKTHVYTPHELARLRRFAAQVEGGELEALDPSIPEYPNRAHWFSDAALMDLGRLRAGIARLDAAPRRLAMAVLSAVLLRASRQDSDTRYARVERDYEPGRAARWFASRLRDALVRVEAIGGLPRASVEHRLGDGRALAGVEEASVDLLVTSPPYLNAYDYHKYHRHRLHWIGGDVALARDREIGKHDTFTRPGAQPEPYFDDMDACFGEWARVLRPGAVAVIVVGDAIVGGEPVAVGDRFTALLAERGLGVERRFLRRLDTGRKSFNQRARIDSEHVLVARRG